MPEAIAKLIAPNAIRMAREGAARGLDRAVFVALLVLIALTAIPYGTVEAWWEAVFECAVFVLGALWALQGLLRMKWYVSQTQLLAPLLALVVFALIQTLPLWGSSAGAAGVETPLWNTISADPFETKRFALKLLSLILCGELLLCYTSTPRRLRALIYVIIAVCMASALFGIVRQTTQRNAMGFVLPYLERGSGYGQMINRNHFAFLMEMALGLATGVVIGGGVRRERLLLYGAAVLPVWAALVLTSSRGGIFSMLNQMLFLALMVSFVRPAQKILEQRHDDSFRPLRVFGSLVTRAALVASLLIAVAVSVVWMGGDELVSRLETLPGEVKTENAEDALRDGSRRLDVWRATWQVIKANPIAGVGFGGYQVAITKNHDASGKLTPEAAHNDYLELLASGGIAGAALALWFGIVFVRQSLARLHSADPFRRAACLGALTGIVGVSLHSFVDFGLHVTINALIFTALIVIAVTYERVEENLSSRDGEQSF